MSWIKKLLSFEYPEYNRRINRWEIRITNNFILLRHTVRYRPIELWDKWGKMQAKVLSSFHQHWNYAHTYFWVQTYIPESLSNVLIDGKYEMMTSINKDEQIFIFPDCQDKNAWETILSMMTLSGNSRCIFILDNKPQHWGDVIIRLHQITQLLEKGHQICEFETELTQCHCLCGSSDEDLVISKIDLKENIVLSVLGDIVKEEGLELVIKRET